MFDDLFNWAENNERKLPGILIGEVIGNYNEELPAHVQVKIHDRTEDMNVTGWARVAMPFAGAERGFYSLPDIGDEVILAFCNGEIDMPIVIGSLYTKNSAPPTGVVLEENTVKTIKTKGGHMITFDDKEDTAAIEITTTAKLQIKLDDKEKTITVKSEDAKNQIKINGKSGEVEVTADKKVTLKCGSSKIVLNNSGNAVSINGDSVAIKAKQSLKFEGQQVEIKGTTTTVKADSKLDLNSSGMTNLKGSMVKLN